MTWGTDHRRQLELPPDWESIRLRVFDRDGWRCTWLLSDGRRCEETTRLECDHKGDRLDHRETNLRTLCHDHHAVRTAWQGAAARRKKRAASKLPVDRHPGWRGPAPT